MDKPEPVFDILSALKEDPIRFVQKSVANHITVNFKVNPDAANQLIKAWQPIQNKHTEWIVKRATRKVNSDL